MREKISAIIILILFVLFAVYQILIGRNATVLNVITPTMIQIDTNGNKLVDENETFCVPDIITFTADSSKNSDIAAKENAAKIRDAYKKLLTECKVGEKHLESILRVTDLKGMKLDEKGNLENAEELKKTIVTDWDGFISTKETRGADVNNPPGNNSNDRQVGRAAEIAARYHDNLYGKKED
jgi:hypothetical protein